MMKIKRWIIENKVPVWAKGVMLKEISRLEGIIKEQEMQIKQLDAYIAGLERGMRAQRRIVINNDGVTKNESKTQ